MKGHCIALVALLVLSGGIAMATPTEVDWKLQNETLADLDVGFHEIIVNVTEEPASSSEVGILVDHDVNIVDVDLFRVPVLDETTAPMEPEGQLVADEVWLRSMTDSSLVIS